jgi:hypothetical protein
MTASPSTTRECAALSPGRREARGRGLGAL